MFHISESLSLCSNLHHIPCQNTKIYYVYSNRCQDNSVSENTCILKEYENKQAVLINNKKCNKMAITIKTNKLQNI